MAQRKPVLLRFVGVFLVRMEARRLVGKTMRISGPIGEPLSPDRMSPCPGQSAWRMTRSQVS